MDNSVNVLIKIDEKSFRGGYNGDNYRWPGTMITMAAAPGIFLSVIVVAYGNSMK